MKITKYGHCCLLIEENGVKILTDPGDAFTEQGILKATAFLRKYTQSILESLGIKCEILEIDVPTQF